MNPIKTRPIPFDAVEAKLAADDDRAFWHAALDVLADEFVQKYAEELANKDWAMVVGACSHWVAPNQMRWTAGGGFASPFGYKSYSPELDWSLVLLLRQGHWIPISKLPGKNLRIFRAALPSRTARHQQAAVHTRWIPGREEILFGFRKTNQRWRCVTASDEKSRGRVSHDALLDAPNHPDPPL